MGKIVHSDVKLIGKFNDFTGLLKDDQILIMMESFVSHWNDGYSKLNTYRRACVLTGNQSAQYMRWTIWHFANNIFNQNPEINECDFLSYLEEIYYREYPRKKGNLSFIRDHEQFKNGLILKRRK